MDIIQKQICNFKQNILNKKLNKKQSKIYNELMLKPGYLKKSANYLWNRNYLNGSLKDITIALAEAKINYKIHLDGQLTYSKPNKTLKKAAKKYKSNVIMKSFADIFPWSKDNIKREITKLDNLKQFGTEYHPKDVAFKSNKKNGFDINNVIFIPDLHSPFIKEGVLDWILDEQKKYNAGTVIFAGDIIDGHAWSYHEHDVDGMSVGDELEAAKKQLRDWYKAFPNAISLLGNHDLLIQRKAKTAGLSKHFIKDFGSIINAPRTWEFKYEHILNNVLYHHGSVGDAFKVAKDRRISTCQGHFHSKTFVQWSVSEVDSIFGLQVGWGADRDKYAFDYGKSFVTKPVLSCGIILDSGRTPIVKLMPL